MRCDDDLDVPILAHAVAVLNEPAFTGFRTRHRTKVAANTVRIKVDVLVFCGQGFYSYCRPNELIGLLASLNRVLG